MSDWTGPYYPISYWKILLHFVLDINLSLSFLIGQYDLVSYRSRPGQLNTPKWNYAKQIVSTAWTIASKPYPPDPDYNQEYGLG
jgi:hypothetical protein